MVALYIAALLLQIVGSLVVALEVHQAHTRWRAKFRAPANLRLHGTIASVLSGVTMTASGVVSGDLTVEDRVARLEEARSRDQSDLKETVERIERQTAEKADESASKVEERLQPQIAETLQYLAGLGERSRWQPWWLGPALLLVGTILGGVGSVIGALGDA
jgi:hypothetical protein